MLCVTLRLADGISVVYVLFVRSILVSNIQRDVRSVTGRCIVAPSAKTEIGTKMITKGSASDLYSLNYGLFQASAGDA